MGRLVRVPSEPAVSEMSIAGLEGVLPVGVTQRLSAPQADSYLERIAKYVPAEVLAFSLFINCILEQAQRNGGASAVMAGIPITTIALGALIAGIVATPLFVCYMRTDGDAWITNAVVSTATFPFWPYAIGAAAFNPVHDGNLAAILLVSATVGSGFISPPRRRERTRARQKAPVERPQLVEVSGNQFSA